MLNRFTCKDKKVLFIVADPSKERKGWKQMSFAHSGSALNGKMKGKMI